MKTILSLAAALNILIVAPAFALVNAKPLEGNADLVRLEFAGGSVCSGFYYKANFIITAGHCLFAQDGTPHVLERILGEKEQVLPVQVIEFINHPANVRGEKLTSDLAAVRTTGHVGFQGQFAQIAKSGGRFKKLTYFGAGKTFRSGETYARTTGEAYSFRYGNFIYSLGKSKNTLEPGTWVTVAPNDSGSPIVDPVTKAVAAIALKTSVLDTLDSAIPAVSVGMVLGTPANLSFLEALK